MEVVSGTASIAGVTSFAFLLFGGCIKGFTLLATAHSLGKDASVISCMLSLQEMHLIEWARRSGLLTGNGELDERLNAKAVEATLKNLETLLNDTTSLKNRYGIDLVAEKPATIQSLHGIASNDFISDVDLVFTSISTRTRQDILKHSGLIQSKNHFPRRMWWAAVDKEKMEKLVEQIRIFISELRFHLDSQFQQELMQETQLISSNMVEINTRFDQLTSLNRALERLAIMESKNDLSASSSIQTLATVAAVKAARVDIGDEVNSKSQEQYTHNRRLKKLSYGLLSELERLRGNYSMAVATYNNDKVFVEEKFIDPALKSKVIPRAENLALLLSLHKDPKFRSLSCKGIIEHEQKITFVYNHPSQENRSLPKSLYQFFSSKDGISPPSLTARIHLALTIAETLLCFHRTGWLHKSLRSQNILFFQSSKSGTESQISLDSPFLAGFAFSRFGLPTEISEQPSADAMADIYRHPSALGEPSMSFSSVMDIYSLGIILLEIAEWQPLKYLIAGRVDVNLDSVPLDKIAEVKTFLLSRMAKPKAVGTSRLGLKTGDIYESACMMCLSGDNDDTSNNLEADEDYLYKRGLLDKVVEMLKSCRI